MNDPQKNIILFNVGLGLAGIVTALSFVFATKLIIIKPVLEPDGLVDKLVKRSVDTLNEKVDNAVEKVSAALETKGEVLNRIIDDKLAQISTLVNGKLDQINPATFVRGANAAVQDKLSYLAQCLLKKVKWNDPTATSLGEPFPHAPRPTEGALQNLLRSQEANLTPEQFLQYVSELTEDDFNMLDKYEVVGSRPPSDEVAPVQASSAFECFDSNFVNFLDSFGPICCWITFLILIILLYAAFAKFKKTK